MESRLKPIRMAIIASLALAALVLPTRYAMANDCCVGFMNLELIIAESTMGKQAGAQFKKERDERQVNLEALYENVKRLKSYIETRASLLNDTELAAKQEEFNKAVADFQKARNDSEAEFKSKNGALIKSILEKIEPILKKVAEERGFLMVVKDPTVIGYIHPSMDISSEVMKRLDAQTAIKPK